jgi:hypothetical protein
MVALSWLWCMRLAERGKDVRRFPSALAAFAARAVHAGRRLCGQQKSKDVLSPVAQRRHNFTTSPLPDGSSLGGNVFDEALQDNTQTPVADQVCFRCDFPRWVRTYGDRDRRVIADLMRGERTTDVSNKYGLSPGRVSQMRRQFLRDWERFCEPPETAAPRGMALPCGAHTRTHLTDAAHTDLLVVLPLDLRCQRR